MIELLLIPIISLLLVVKIKQKDDILTFLSSNGNNQLSSDYRYVHRKTKLWRYRSKNTQVVVYYIKLFRVMEQIIILNAGEDQSLATNLDELKHKMNKVELNILHSYRKHRNEYIHQGIEIDLSEVLYQINQIFFILSKLIQSNFSLVRNQGVSKKHSYGHGTNSTWNGSD
ncbi:MAG: hypothetical protein INQ03_11850 [Candidatus Heimdallarchaeota archaeon]|nr:hypothetical protein [Candidatus Heimdallarchaeota archaeon]